MKNRRTRFAVVLLLFLGVWSSCAWLAARALIVRTDLPRADALVVLSGSSTYLERSRWAAQLYRQGSAPKIILTNDGQQGGWSTSQQKNPLFFERAKDELNQSGVPMEKIEVLPRTVSSTYDEAMILRENAVANGMHSILLVTSAYHSRRALWTARHVFCGSGIEIGLDPVPAGKQTPSPSVWWLYHRGWQMVAEEYVKLIYYRLRYRG
jgi:uncharacterized SAM-binding protein YcdF (DUF218 family)